MTSPSTLTSPTPTPTPTTTTIATAGPRRFRKFAAVAVVAGALGVAGAFAVASAQDDDATPPAAQACGATENDLLRAADAARVLEAQRPELYAVSPAPATEHDLQMAAEWSSRMSVLDPNSICGG